MVGGRNDLVIEPNIMRRPAPNPVRRPAPETMGLPPPSVPTREPVAEPPPKRLHHNLFRDRAYPATTVKQYEEVALSTPGPGIRYALIEVGGNEMRAFPGRRFAAG